MMKILFQITILFLAFQSCKGPTDTAVSHKVNYIDSIQNTRQITDLISKIGGKHKDFKLNSRLKFTNRTCQNLSDSLKAQPWAKADFDNNGLTDILVMGSWYGPAVIDTGYIPAVICILDKGGYYKINQITRVSVQNCAFAIVENEKIKYYFESIPKLGDRGTSRKIQEATLIYKFGDFIEENQHPSNHKIEKIAYSTTACYGTCPVFNLTINADKTAKWDAIKYNEINNKEVSGNFSSKIADDKYNEIVDLLNYIDFEALQDDYSIDWTDDQSSTLKITYDNGKVKSIQDYGLMGTYGLDRANQLFFELRRNQKWTK